MLPIGLLARLMLLGLGGYAVASFLRESFFGTGPLRRVFFSFHYQRDVWRANQVKNSWVTQERLAAGFFNASLEETAKTNGKKAVKDLIERGLNGSSVTCVLIGAETYRRHWVNYEIFRSISLGKGLLGIRIHGLENQSQAKDKVGPNPFDFLRLILGDSGKVVPQAKYGTGWANYPDVDPFPVGAAPYITIGKKSPFQLVLHPSVSVEKTQVLSDVFRIYDWVGDKGYENFNSWVQDAAKQAER